MQTEAVRAVASAHEKQSSESRDPAPGRQSEVLMLSQLLAVDAIMQAFRATYPKESGTHRRVRIRHLGEAQMQVILEDWGSHVRHAARVEGARTIKMLAEQVGGRCDVRFVRQEGCRVRVTFGDTSRAANRLTG